MAMATEELKALCAFHPKSFTDSDVAAAQQLVQLSGEDSSSCSNKKRRKNKSEKDEVARPRKQRYRSLVSIYQQAMDMPLRSNVRYGKEVSTEGNLNRALAREEEGDQCSKTQAIRRLF
ncbi:hypothetical protein OIU78_028505 [Salix suchowensis]|nr:hypothetical protein OIU78_028505 [Salix suchowensis]